MGLYTGTATNYLDLLNKIVTAATTEGWTVKENTTSGYTVDGGAILYNTGLAGADDIYVGLYAANSAAPYFKLQGYTNYEAGYSFDTQAGAIPSPVPIVPLSVNNMPYWVTVNDQRICGVIKVNNGIYESFYLGLTLPSTFPEKMPYPLFVGGGANLTSILISDTSSNHSAFWQAYGNNIATFLNGGVWLDGSLSGLRDYSTGLHCSPYGYPYRGTQADDYYPLFRPYVGKNMDGTFPTFPIALCYQDTTVPVYCGDLDGWRAIKAQAGDLNSEDTITIGADTYYVFNNTFRTSDHNYILLKGA